MDGLDKVLTELKAQGRNLNQLTTLANMGKSTMVYGDRLAEGYAREQAQEAGAEAITVPGWECAWYAADAVPYGGQMLVLQSGKTVWRIGYDGEHRLTDALGVFARA